MIKTKKNKIGHKYYKTYHVFNQRSHNRALASNQFVVPWQMEEVRKEKKGSK